MTYIDDYDLISLDELKKQMNVDYDDDDAYIETLGRVAVQTVIQRTRRDSDELCVMNGGTFPESLRLAMLQLAAHWYRVRENVSNLSQVPVPYTLDFLTKPWTRLGRVRPKSCSDD